MRPGFAPPAAGGPRPRPLSYAEVRSENIDVAAQQALLRMSQAAPAAADAVGLARAVATGTLAGIYRENQRAPALRAQRMNRGWWQVIPPSEEAAVLLEASAPLAAPPMIVFRNRVASNPTGLDAVLRKAWGTFRALVAGDIELCSEGGRAGLAATRAPLGNIVPPVLCTLTDIPQRDRIGGRQTVHCYSEGACGVERVSVWFNSFLPGEITDITRTVALGQHAGKTAITDTDVNCLLTDQRDFDPDPQALSRSHSRIDIDIPSGAFRQSHRVDTATAVLCRTGVVSCGMRGGTALLGFSNFRRRVFTADDSIFRFDPNVVEFKVDYRCETRNPCAVTPFLIQLSGTVTVSASSRLGTVDVKFSGIKRQFPAYEMYASVNDGPGQSVFLRIPFPGVTLQDAPASRRVRGSAMFVCC
ncbi:MAG TPA: hypothetical protein VER08_03720 [Pyrinomonadaceae bacterium]|nr:hypothetical protein [Pyrinomonadaceae bacterium]